MKVITFYIICKKFNTTSPFLPFIFARQEHVDPNYTLSLITKPANLIVSKNNSIPLQSLETLYL